MNNTIDRILELKKKKNAVILAHNYQTKEIFEIADFIWDSYDLSLRAKETNADIIVFAWVKFMAESAKLLNPSKKVLLPSVDAWCFMAERISLEQIKQFKAEHPNAKVVSYVNTFADVKSETDVCCTSANALKIVENIDADEIIFTPDRNLWAYIQSKVDKKIHIWDQWFCFLHELVTDASLQNTREDYPDGILLMHPETPLRFHKYADHLLWTWWMIKYVKNSDNNLFLIATESNMCERLKFDFPDKTFIPLMWRCRYMAKITPENILAALEKDQYEIEIPEEIAGKALNSLEEMIRLS